MEMCSKQSSLSLLHQGFQARACKIISRLLVFHSSPSAGKFHQPESTLDMQFHLINIDSLPKRTRMAVSSVSTCGLPESARIQWKSRAFDVWIIVLRFRNWFCGLALAFTDDSSELQTPQRECQGARSNFKQLLIIRLHSLMRFRTTLLHSTHLLYQRRPLLSVAGIVLGNNNTRRHSWSHLLTILNFFQTVMEIRNCCCDAQLKRHCE